MDTLAGVEAITIEIALIEDTSPSSLKLDAIEARAESDEWIGEVGSAVV